MGANQPSTGFWLTDASVPLAEIVARLDFDFVVLDAEHGMFDLRTLESFIPVLSGLGLEVLTKVVAPSQASIQQALDFGSDGVIIPHVGGVDHAAQVTAHAKFPMLGDRSMAGGRAFDYQGWDAKRISALNDRTLCMPLIEHPDAVRDIELIAALDTVDGMQLGASDLALMSGRGGSRRTGQGWTEDDWTDIARCVAAFNDANKTWMFPAWSLAEQTWALEHQAPRIIIAMQYHWIRSALTQAKEQYDLLDIASRPA